MARDVERIERIRRRLAASGLDALVCGLPTHVLLLSGYWPVVGTALAIATRDGRILVIAPEDELELARRGGADEVRTFKSGSLERVSSLLEEVYPPLQQALLDLGLTGRRVGYESGAVMQPASYVSMHLYRADLFRLLTDALYKTTIVPADELLEQLRSVCTPAEIARIRTACRIAGLAFDEGAMRLRRTFDEGAALLWPAVYERDAPLRPGLTEAAAAVSFQAPLSARGIGFDGVERADGFVACMSGDNASHAHGAYARSRATPLREGTLALVHCNSNADGYWTDITRTYCLGAPTAMQQRMYDAVLEARAAALEAIRPGARAADVDRAARDCLEARGFGDAFKHPTGHGVGFAAIDHDAIPRIHPKSTDGSRPGWCSTSSRRCMSKGTAACVTATWSPSPRTGWSC
jgi:Xaa-Pro aminopeptidase/Xaa-Pro dipeptidase